MDLIVQLVLKINVAYYACMLVRSVDLVNECFRDLYTPQGLIEKLNISSKTINDWRVRGVLVNEIKAAFYRLPEDSRGLYFPWFLQNEHIVALAGKPLSDKEIRDSDDAIWRGAWLAIGGRERASFEEIQAAISRRSAEEVMCYTLYMAILSTCLPSSHFLLWIEFGFASCTSEEEENALYGQYQRLITMCTFDEFCDAYCNHRLLDLFHSKGLQVSSNACTLLRNSEVQMELSVWLLKKFVLHGPSSTEEFNMMARVILDYGVNCRNPGDWQQLRKVYKDFFTIHHGDASAFYKARIEGNLYGFLSNVMPGLTQEHQRLLTLQPYTVLSSDLGISHG